MNKRNIVNAICFLVAALFFYTGMMKLMTYQTFVFDMLQSPLIRHSVFLQRTLPPSIGVAVPAAEIITAALVCTERKRTGLVVSILLMAVFTVYVGYILITIPDHLKRPCTCGGVLREMSWPIHLIFNLFYLGISALGFCLVEKGEPVDNKRYSVNRAY